MSQTFRAEPEEKRGCGLSHLLVGCLIVFGICILLCCGGIFAAYKYGKPLAVSAMEKVAVEVIDNLELSDEDKAAVKAEIKRVAEACKSGDMTVMEASEILQALVESPAFIVVIVEAAEKQYVAPSGLDRQEKDDASLILQRTARGIIEERISPDDIQSAARYIAEQDADGNWELRDPADVTDDDLRALLAECKQLADDAGIPAEEYHVDIGDEVKKAVDEALQE